MDNPADYDSDILLWSEKQAQIIRDLAKHVRGLPNELDLENVAEEIESVGRSEFRAAESLLQTVFSHLIKSASHAPDFPPQRKWFGEIVRFRREFLRAMSPAMIPRLEPEKLWEGALLDARISAGKYDEELPHVPQSCPFSLAALVREDFDLIAAEKTLRSEIARLNAPTA